jgi:capsular polysaccharide biosynthesis protein
MNQRVVDTKFLDILLVIAENLRLLLIMPILMIALAFSASYFIPKSYTSEALIHLNPQEMMYASTLMTSSGTLIEIKKELHMAYELSNLSKQIKVIRGRDGLLKIEVTDAQPQRAKMIAEKIVEIWLRNVVLNNDVRKELEHKRRELLSTIESTNLMVANLYKYFPTEALGQENSNIKNSADLLELHMRYLTEILNVTQLLYRGVTSDSIAQFPTLPNTATTSHINVLIIFFVLLMELILLLGIFIRHHWLNAQKIPDIAVKQQRLLASLLFWRT